MDSLNVCRIIHQDTGETRIPLSDIAREMVNGTTKEQIQEAFHVLVALEYLGDDGDYDYMNYDGNLKEILTEFKNNL